MMGNVSVSAVLLSILVLFSNNVEAQVSPKKAAPQKQDQVYVKVIMPSGSTALPIDSPIVESWIGDQLKNRREPTAIAVTSWVPITIQGEESTQVWDGKLSGKTQACHVVAQIAQVADGNIKVSVDGWMPFPAGVIISLRNEPGAREVVAVERARTEQGVPYVAVLIAPPLEK